jgi:endonuclease/exonuclease/phosphatase family metal-dependent hydrolase
MKRSKLKTIGLTLLILIAVIILYVAIVAIVNRMPQSTKPKTPKIEGSPSAALDDQTLKILSWNIGYAGMGEDSDFLFDNGSQLRPPSKLSVTKNLEGITQYLQSNPFDIVMLQEIPYASWNNYNVNVYPYLKNNLDMYQWTYSDDLYTKLLPSFTALRIGNSTASRIKIEDATSIALTREPGYFLYFFKKDYRMHITHIEHAGAQWSIINVHLSAFDDDSVSIREAQLKEIISFAQEEKEKGYHVIVGGDWNLELVQTDFGPYTTSKEDQFWIRSLPEFAKIDGWKWVADPSTPSVRTAEKPFVKGENYTLVIDGFFISDTIDVVDVHTQDLSFKVTDHQPVTLLVKANDS